MDAVGSRFKRLGTNRVLGCFHAGAVRLRSAEFGVGNFQGNKRQGNGNEKTNFLGIDRAMPSNSCSGLVLPDWHLPALETTFREQNSIERRENSHLFPSFPPLSAFQGYLFAKWSVAFEDQNDPAKIKVGGWLADC